MKRLAIALVLLFEGLFSHAQNVETVAKSSWFKPTGGLTVQVSAYQTDHPNFQQDPLFWSLNGNFTATVKSVTIPFTVSINKRQSSYALPFNQLRSLHQFGMSPTYKNFTLHAGNRSLSFSPYTLAGQTFLGGGFQWHNNKRNVQFTTLGGQFAKADPSGQTFALPFDRYGYGAQASVTGRSSLAASYLYFWDVPGASLDSVHHPMTNRVMGLNASHDINDRLTLSADFNVSGFTVASTPDATERGSEQNQHKSSYSAVELKLQRNGQRAQTGIKYRRIEPGYQTMGAPYVNNDMEDLTGQFSTQFIKNKVSLGLSAGAQKNNLNNHLSGTQLRTVGSIQLNWRIAKAVNFNVNAANYTVNPSRVLLYQIDSMELYQVNSNVHQTLTYILTRSTTTHTLMVNHGYQIGTTTTDNTEFNNMMLSYAGSNKSSLWQWNSSLTYFSGTLSGLTTSGYTPSVSLGKKIFKSKLSVRGTYAYQFRSSGFEERTHLASISGTYQHKKQQLGVSGSWLDRNSSRTGREELRINMTYSVRL